jgi:anti-sigma regulatory factor (Ser/Thr protein kinase)
MAIATLSALIVDARSAGVSCEVTPPTLDRLLNYCVYSGFAQLAGFGGLPTESPRNETIPSRVFSTRDETGVHLVCGLVRRHMALTHHGANVLATMIGEMTQNVADHAGASGVLAARFLDGRNVVRVCVADRGRGLMASLGEKFDVPDDRRALALALEKGATSGSARHNRGQGLNLLDHLVAFNGGRMVLASGGACYERAGAKSKFGIFKDPSRVSGTVCFFEFNVSNDLYPDDESNDALW